MLLRIINISSMKKVEGILTQSLKFMKLVLPLSTVPVWLMFLVLQRNLVRLKPLLSRNLTIWETILCACKLLGNIEQGLRAAEKLFQLERKINYHILFSDFWQLKETGMILLEVIRASICSRGKRKTQVADGQSCMILIHNLAQSCIMCLLKLWIDYLNVSTLPLRTIMV